MTKEEKLYEVYGSKYDWDEDGWLFYGCDEETETGFEPFGEYETRNHIDGYYEWRPIKLQGIENNNGWIKIESEEDLPTESSNYWIQQSDGRIQTIKEYFDNKEYYNITATGYQPIEKPKSQIY